MILLLRVGSVKQRVDYLQLVVKWSKKMETQNPLDTNSFPRVFWTVKINQKEPSSNSLQHLTVTEEAQLPQLSPNTVNKSLNSINSNDGSCLGFNEDGMCGHDTKLNEHTNVSLIWRTFPLQ